MGGHTAGCGSIVCVIDTACFSAIILSWNLFCLDSTMGMNSYPLGNIWKAALQDSIHTLPPSFLIPCYTMLLYSHVWPSLRMGPRLLSPIPQIPSILYYSKNNHVFHFEAIKCEETCCRVVFACALFC